MVYTVEQDEVLKARHRTLSQQKPKPVAAVVPKKKTKRRKRRNLSTKALKRIKRLEGQGTKIFRDVPPNVVGLRRKPKIQRREKGLSDLGIVEDTRSNEQIMQEFLS